MNATGWEPTDMAALPIGQVDAVDAAPGPRRLQHHRQRRGLRPAQPGQSHHRERRPAGRGRGAAPAREALDPSTATTLKRMLEGVVTSGTGAKAAIPGYLIAGKTGTAAIPGPNGYLAGDYNATFVGFAPAGNPVLSAIVVLQRPTPDFFGGDTAAPVFAKIMSYALHRYGIPTSPGGSGSQTAAANQNSVKEIT